MGQDNHIGVDHRQELRTFPDMRQIAAVAFILVTLFIDILGIGIVIPVLPKLVTVLLGGEQSGDAISFPA